MFRPVLGSTIVGIWVNLSARSVCAAIGKRKKGTRFLIAQSAQVNDVTAKKWRSLGRCVSLSRTFRGPLAGNHCVSSLSDLSSLGNIVVQAIVKTVEKCIAIHTELQLTSMPV